MLSKLVSLASTEQFEAGFYLLMLPGLGVGQKFVDLEATDLLADHVAEAVVGP